MTIDDKYKNDAEIIISHRFDNGGDYWATADKRLLKGAPFTTFDSISFLLELGMPADEPLLKEAAALIFSVQRKDGRFKIYPNGGMYPCQSAIALQTLCHMGYADDSRLQQTFQYFIDTQQGDGGWRCNKHSFGHGPETIYSNPGPTLQILDAFRYSSYHEHPIIEKAIEFLLQHWIIKKPIGPCHYGIGTLFKQIEYPFRGYNIFSYVHTLSYYEKARTDKRFIEALAIIESKLIHDQVVVERVVPKLAKLTFCEKGKPSELATKRYHEIQRNMMKN